MPVGKAEESGYFHGHKVCHSTGPYLMEESLVLQKFSWEPGVVTRDIQMDQSEFMGGEVQLPDGIRPNGLGILAKQG